MRKIISVTVIGLVLAINAFCQIREISRDDYYKAFREADAKFRKVPARREVTKEESYENGKLTRTQQVITEDINPDRWRFLVVETSGERTDKSDLIRIGRNYYCRRNDGAWKNSASGCNQGWATGFTNIVSEKSSVETLKENGKTIKLYRNYVVHKLTDASKQEVVWYYDSKFWLTEDGDFLRSATEAGLKETNELRLKSETNYSHNPRDLKIKAPVK
jgi:hypothetical protein